METNIASWVAVAAAGISTALDCMRRLVSTFTMIWIRLLWTFSGNRNGLVTRRWRLEYRS